MPWRDTKLDGAHRAAILRDEHGIEAGSVVQFFADGPAYPAVFGSRLGGAYKSWDAAVKAVEAMLTTASKLDLTTVLEKRNAEITLLRATLLNIQAMAERGNPIDTAKLAEQCRQSLKFGGEIGRQ